MDQDDDGMPYTEHEREIRALKRLLAMGVSLATGKATIGKFAWTEAAWEEWTKEASEACK